MDGVLIAPLLNDEKRHLVPSTAHWVKVSLLPNE